LINIDIQELPIQLGQVEVGIITQVKQWINDWHAVIEIILLLIIIGILLSDRQ